MDTEARKISIACFTGGVLFCAVALLVAPAYWWLGLVAGLAGGYLSYEFREVCTAVPVAWRSARQGSARKTNLAIKSAREWLATPHPFAYSGMLAVLPFWAWNVYDFLGDATNAQPMPAAVRVAGIMAGSGLLAVIFGLLAALIAVVLGAITALGANSEKCFWVPTVIFNYGEQTEMIQNGYRRAGLTYRDSLRWFLKGVGVVLRFVAWDMWKLFGNELWTGACFFVRFAWRLFRLIHVEKRVLCAIDGTLGGLTSYFWLGSTATHLPAQVLVILCGGLMGAALGLVNYEIVSKRILGLEAGAN